MKTLRSHVVLPTHVDFTMDALYKPNTTPQPRPAGNDCAEPRDDTVTACSHSAGPPVGGHLMIVAEIGRRSGTAGRFTANGTGTAGSPDR